MEVENTSGKDSGNYRSFAKTGAPESFLVLCLGRELRKWQEEIMVLTTKSTLAALWDGLTHKAL